jgi:hypothetical protein
MANDFVIPMPPVVISGRMGADLKVPITMYHGPQTIPGEDVTIKARNVLARIQKPDGSWHTVIVDQGNPYWTPENGGAWEAEDYDSYEHEFEGEPTPHFDYTLTIPAELLNQRGTYRGYLHSKTPGEGEYGDYYEGDYSDDPSFRHVPFILNIDGMLLDGIRFAASGALNANDYVVGADARVAFFTGDTILDEDNLPKCFVIWLDGTWTTAATITLTKNSNFFGGAGCYYATIPAAIINKSGRLLLSLYYDGMASFGEFVATAVINVVRATTDQLVDKNQQFEHTYAPANVPERNVMAGKLDFTTIKYKLDATEDFITPLHTTTIYYFYDQMTADGVIIKASSVSA